VTQILRGDARRLPLADASVDLVVTSPPYWALRSYTDAGEHYDGQIGAEPTPAAYVDSLIDCTREWVRVLKPGGSMWINLGDKYATRWSSRSEGVGLQHDRGRDSRGGRNDTGMPEKSLIGLPWRYAIRCIDELGLILRAEVIWSKPNGLPESVTDRVRRSHEQWFHFVRSPRYFAAVDTIRETYAPGTAARYASGYTQTAASSSGQTRNGVVRMDNGGPNGTNPLGKLPGSVWTIATQPLKVPAELGIDHFAAFPMEWPRRIISGWSPSGICTACGEGRRCVVDRADVPHWKGGTKGARNGERGERALEPRTNTVVSLTGEACACPDASAPTRPAVVLDPFGGTGTTALVAAALGRHGISVDMSADYCRLAQWRVNDPGQRAAALEVEKPAVEHVGQLDLFAGEGAA
jgi:DNA modification methylase